MSTFDDIFGGAFPITKHSGGRYQYVPAPWEGSMIFDSPKSVIFISPMLSPESKMFPANFEKTLTTTDQTRHPQSGLQ